MSTHYPRYRGLVGRIISAVYTGNVDMLKVLFDCGLLEPTDTFDLTGHDYHGDTACDNGECVSLLHIVAQIRTPCADYRDLIDLFLAMGVDINIAMPNTPLEEAIINNNFATAKYLKSKGATYRPTFFAPIPEYLEAFNAYDQAF